MMPGCTNSNNVQLTDGDIRFILWAIEHVDTTIDEGMDYYSRMTEYRLLVARLREHLPETKGR